MALRIFLLLLIPVAYLNAQVNNLSEICNINEINPTIQPYISELINIWNKKADRTQYFNRLRELKNKIYVIEIGSFSSKDYNVGAAFNENGSLVILENDNKKLKFKKKKKRTKFDNWYKTIFESKHDFDKKDSALMIITIIEENKPDTTYIRYGL